MKCFVVTVIRITAGSPSIGGGVLIADLKAKIIESDPWNCIEQVWIAIELENRKLFLCVVYIPPDRCRDVALIDAHTDSVAEVVGGATVADEVIVLGDFNLPDIAWRPSRNGFLYADPSHSRFHAASTKLLDGYSTATLMQFNNIINENNRSLDLCFVSAKDVAPIISAAPAPLVKVVPHHPSLLLTLEKYSPDDDSGFTPATVVYDFRKADYRSIMELLSGLNWETILDQDDIDAAALTFSHVLSYAIDRHVPKRICSPVGQKPWQTTELKRLKSLKRAALRKFSKHRTLQLKSHYIRLNLVYKKVSHQSFQRYQRDIQRKLKSNPKAFWNFVNEQRKESSLPSSMFLNDDMTSEAQKICNLFVKKFSGVFSNENLSSQQIQLAANNVPLFNQTMGAFHVDNAMITSAAAKLKSSSNAGPDGIPSIFLKKNIDGLLNPLRHLFRLSLESGKFPSCWKSAYMFPVHKKGNRRDINNYRGISSLCAVSKLFELVVMEPLLSHCKHYLHEDQHGFLPGRSTTSNLLCLTSYITDSFAERDQTDVIYTDLSAAFDKINHDITIAKLERLGIQGTLLRWFNSYLNGREMTVTIEDCRSIAFPATSGIPQGSHLGPILFLIYFNDVNYVIEGPRLSYADDLKVYIRINSLADALFLQRQLDALANWCELNRMVINPNKCSVISFTRKKHPITFAYSLLGVEIPRVTHVKDLGVILDSRLSFKEHISFIVDKSSRTLGFIFRIAKNFTDVYCLKSLYCALVRSTLEYCSAVWNPFFQNGVERIESVQRRFIRFALRRLPWQDPFRLPSYESRCLLIHLDTLRSRRDVARALVVADLLQGRMDCPAILEQININVQPRALRNPMMLRAPFSSTNYGLRNSINGLQRIFNSVAAAFEFHLSRQTLCHRFRTLFSGNVER